MSDAIRIADSIASGAVYQEGNALFVSLSEFRDIYKEVVRQLSNQNPVVTMVFFEQEVVAFFPQYSAQKIIIQNSNKSYLKPQQFDFIIHRNDFGLTSEPTSFMGFLLSELISYWNWLLPTFVVSLIGLHFAGSENTYAMLSGLLIQSATVFISIFLIFTVTQSALLQKDLDLFKQGILQQYRHDDRNVAILGLAVIIVVILNSIFVSLPYEWKAVVQGYELNKENAWAAMSTSIVITMLVNAFISIVGYYLNRSQDVADRDLTEEVFIQEVKQYKPVRQKTEIGQDK